MRSRLRHDGGTQPIEAELRDEIDYPYHLLPQIDSNGSLLWIDVSSPTGGVSPLQANLEYAQRVAQNPIQQIVSLARHTGTERRSSPQF